MIEFRKQIKELVTYILNPRERDEDVIDNYTDTVMLACEEYHIKQLKLYGVGISLPKVCKGCGSLSTKVIDKKYLACCPDSNYIPMEEYCKNSIYPEKQF